MPQRSAAGAATPSRAKYSRRWRAISGAAAERGEDVDEAEHLHLETLVRHGPLHHLALQALAREPARLLAGHGGEDLPGGLLDAILGAGDGAHRRPPLPPVAAPSVRLAGSRRGSAPAEPIVPAREPGRVQSRGAAPRAPRGTIRRRRRLMDRATTSPSPSSRMDDYAVVHVLWQRGDLWMRPSDGPEATLLKLTRDPGLFLVARDADGRVVGTVMGGWDGRRAYVYHLAVAPERRRAGHRRRAHGRARGALPRARRAQGEAADPGRQRDLQGVLRPPRLPARDRLRAVGQGAGRRAGRRPTR